MNFGTFQGAGTGNTVSGTFPLTSPFLPIRYYTSSGTFIVPMDCWVSFLVVGGGGGGGVETDAFYAIATGGGAGGLAIKTIFCVKGSIYNITVGAGGTANNDGGTSSVFGPNCSVFAYGGTKGNKTRRSGNPGSYSYAAISASAGGSAVGGDVNYQGGSGGAISAQTNTPNYRAIATGGGAVGLFGTGNSAGSVTSDGSTDSQSTTGGAGTGGGSGNVSTVNNLTGGGGSWAASSANSVTAGLGKDGRINTKTLALTTSNTFLNMELPDLFGIWVTSPGGTANSANDKNAIGPGGGGGAMTSTSAVTGGAGGIFGGGGAATTTGSTNPATGGSGGFGGGGGAASSHHTGNAAGLGGQGFIAVMVYNVRPVGF